VLKVEKLLPKAGMSNSNYIVGRKSNKNCRRGRPAAKVLKLSYSGHILLNLEVKNDFTVFLVPKNGF